MEYALITGATSGIGYALAECFAKDGVGLVLVSSSLEHLRQTKEKMEQKYDTLIELYEKDLSLPQAAEELYQEIKERQTPVTFLVNNAGFGLLGATDEIDMAQEERMLQLNMLTPVKLTKLFLPDMERRQRGYILNVASTGAFQPGPYNSTYYASKAFLYSYSRAICKELKEKGIVVSTLCPGTTGTAAYAGLRKERDVIVPGALNQVLRIVPAGVKLNAVAKMKKKQAKSAGQRGM